MMNKYVPMKDLTQEIEQRIKFTEELASKKKAIQLAYEAVGMKKILKIVKDHSVKK